MDRLTRLVGDLLLLAQAESGKLPLVKATVEMDSLVFEVLNQMHVLAKDRVSLTLGEVDQVLVCGDKDRLKQVLVNLVGNAIKYTPVGGEVVVGVGKDGNRARLTVSDNGTGIPRKICRTSSSAFIGPKNRALVARRQRLWSGSVHRLLDRAQPRRADRCIFAPGWRYDFLCLAASGWGRLQHRN